MAELNPSAARGPAPRAVREVPDRVSLDGVEERWDASWSQQGLYAFDRTAERGQVYSIDTPPPPVSGSLHVGPGGPRLFDTPEFPAEYKPESLELAAVLDELRDSPEQLDWFYISPAAGFGAYAPGERTGTFRLGDEVLLTDSEGRSDLSGADLAVAILDEVENPTHRRARFTAAY